jgi:hypothetical protein
MIQKEVWKKLGGLEYEISNLGNMYSLLTNAEMKPFLDSRGYLQVYVYSEGNRALRRIHRLVAQNFLEEVQDCLIVNHLDCDKQNNEAINLEWTTTRGNAIHASENGLLLCGEEHHLSLLKEDEVLEIIALLQEGVRDCDIAKAFKVASNTIADVRSGRTWKHLLRDSIDKLGPKKKLTGEDIPFIRDAFTKGLRDCDIAKEYHVATATINQIRHGNTWRNY